MAQIQQPHDQYPNPFAYFANTHVSIEKRKRKAATGASNMKIVNLTQNPDNSFNVLIKGNRGMTYEVLFSEQSITCSCPDFQKHTVKPICKHMFKLICISENHDDDCQTYSDFSCSQSHNKKYKNLTGGIIMLNRKCRKQ